MTDKKIKNPQKSPMPQEDIQLYRLFLIFGVAILGFFAFRSIPKNTFYQILGVGQWIAAVLALAVIAAVVYTHCIKKIDESNHIITSVGAAYFLVPVLFMLATYRSVQEASFKFQVFFVLISIFAIIYNIFKREFKNITALTFVCAIGIYYAATPVYSAVETIISVIAQIVMFAFPVFVIALLAAAFANKKGTVTVFGREIYKLPSKFGGLLAIVMSALLLVAAALVFFVSASFTYVMISLLVLYVIVGIVCTIRLI